MGNWLTKFKEGIAIGREEVSTSREVLLYKNNNQIEERGGNFPAPDKPRQKQPRLMRRKIYAPRAVIVQENGTFIYENYEEYTEWEE
jgi:hypothetical protein